MHSSLFRQQRPYGAPRDVSPLDLCRNDIIESLFTYLAQGPTHASACYLWPSAERPVGCGRCNYASPMSLIRVTRYCLGLDPGPIMRLLDPSCGCTQGRAPTDSGVSLRRNAAIRSCPRRRRRHGGVAAVHVLATAKWRGEKDVITGQPVVHRDANKLEDVTAVFVSSLPVPVSLAAS